MHWHYSDFSSPQLIPLRNAGSSPSFSASLHIARLLFDLSFFIIVITIGLNVVFGIIVDTFSELREERVWIFLPYTFVIFGFIFSFLCSIISMSLSNFLLFQSDVETDQKSTCFICDLPNHEFERKGTVRKNAYIHYAYYGSDKLRKNL